MSFSFSGFLQTLAGNTILRGALQSMATSIGKQVLDKINAPEELHALGKQLVQDAPAIADAVIANTEVAHVAAPLPSPTGDRPGAGLS